MSLPFTLAFLLGAPRSGTTMLERMLSGHTQIQGGPEPHLVTPLAHLGYWRRVDKAPYDQLVAAIGQKNFVKTLPRGESDYWRACRAYCEVLYGAAMEGNPARVYLDKTPENTTVWPFLLKVFPDARFVVLTRHPGAIFTSFVHSFFDGDCEAAQRRDPVVERYVPSLAALLREHDSACLHLRYEDLVRDPETWTQKICEHLRVPYEAEIIDYGTGHSAKVAESGLGDPIGVDRHHRPSEAQIHAWIGKIREDPQMLKAIRDIVTRLDPEDLTTIGYPPSTFWEPLEAAGSVHPRQTGFSRYHLKRRLIVRGRKLVGRSRTLRAGFEWLRMACDVMLRDT